MPLCTVLTMGFIIGMIGLQKLTDHPDLDYSNPGLLYKDQTPLNVNWNPLPVNAIGPESDVLALEFFADLEYNTSVWTPSTLDAPTSFDSISGAL